MRKGLQDQRKRKVVPFSLDPDAVTVLETVPKGGRSDYVSELIIDDGVDRGILGGPALDQNGEDGEVSNRED